MQSFLVDARDGGTLSNPCDSCCCFNASAVPGETNLFEIDYSPWSMPIGGHGLCNDTDVSIEVIKAENENNPQNSNYGFSTKASVALNGTVATDAVPTNSTFTYELHPLQQNKHGVLVFNADGTFTFNANGVPLGLVTFWYIMTDENGRSATRIVQINVVADALPVNPIQPDPQKIVVNPKSFTYYKGHDLVRFPITANLNATVGEIHRVTLTQKAMDCDKNEFTNIQCIDVVIGKCR